jgi:U3 small nucleolar RNA-associated protein 7
MKDHERPYRLDFLPYHYLLTSCGHSGWIKWHDISTGTYVAGYGSGHGPCKVNGGNSMHATSFIVLSINAFFLLQVMTHNPKNAVSHLGHSNGVVSLWSPASGKAVRKLFRHNTSPIHILREIKDTILYHLIVLSARQHVLP